MTYGSLRALYDTLQGAPSFAQSATARPVSFLFGEENIVSQDQPTPFVCLVPSNSTFGPGGEGFYVGNDPSVILWMSHESIDLYLWDYDESLGAGPIDHADAVENLRARVLQALQYQAPIGLKFYPVNGRWQSMGDATNRYGRGYVLTVNCDVAIADVSPVEATIERVTLDPVEIVDQVPLSTTLTEQF